MKRSRIKIIANKEFEQQKKQKFLDHKEQLTLVEPQTQIDPVSQSLILIESSNNHESLGQDNPEECHVFMGDLPLLPIRCITCNKILGHLSFKIREWKMKNGDAKGLCPLLDFLGLTRLCCRKEIISHWDAYNHMQQFQTIDIWNPKDIDEQDASNSLHQKKRIILAR